MRRMHRCNIHLAFGFRLPVHPPFLCLHHHPQLLPMLRLEIGLWRLVALSVVAATAIGIWQRPGIWSGRNGCGKHGEQGGAVSRACSAALSRADVEVRRISSEGPILVVEAEVAEEALRFGRPFVGGFFAEPSENGLDITQVYGHEATPELLSLVQETLTHAVPGVSSDELPKIVEVHLMSGFSEPMLHCRAKSSCGTFLP